MFNLIDNYSFIPVSGCVGRAPSALLCRGGVNTVKTTLTITLTLLNVIFKH
jgi:hypothetical protein